MEQYLIYNTLWYPILTVLMAVPLFGAFITLGIRGDQNLKIWGLLVTVLTTVLSLPLFFSFDLTTAKYQFAEFNDWIPFVDISYVLGVDGISVLLVLLTTLVMPLCILCSWSYIKERFREFSFFHFLGSHAGSHVPDYCRMGRTAQRLCIY